VLGIFGVFPELLFLMELVLGIIVDWIYWGLVDKSHSLLSNDTSIVNQGLEDLV
jgi:hypothetical protein